MGNGWGLWSTLVTLTLYVLGGQWLGAMEHTCYINVVCFRWAMAEGYGAHLLSKPELVKDMVRTASSQSGLPISIKIRVKRDLRYTSNSVHT